MLFLQYGVNADGALIGIDQVGRGKSELRCPYCAGALIARKGERIAHHFAHVSDSCNPAMRDMEAVSLPAYDNFNLHLPGRAVQELHLWAKDRRGEGFDEDYLEEHSLLRESDYKEGWYDLTKKGKIVLGQLSLDLFNQYQEPLILQRHEAIEKNIQRAETDTDRQMYLTDLRLYRAQMRRILSCTLYFLQIGTTGLHKIGVTMRPIEERLREIAADLLPIFGAVQITVIGAWSARGNVEFYFKHRYRNQQHLLGTLTEYYQFNDIKAVIRDLRRMKEKELTPLEQGILQEDRPEIELRWESEQIEQRRIAAIKPGIERARQRGKQLGRPPGRETREDILSRPYVSKIQEALAAGLSLRDAARAAGVALSTVQKVKAAMGEPPAPATEGTLITRDDLPKGDLKAIWKFIADKYREMWGELWSWSYGRPPARLEKGGAYYLGEGELFYLGDTHRDVINNALYYLNNGADDPVKRLRLTSSEWRMLRQLGEKSVTIQDDKPTEALCERLIVKGLVRKAYSNAWSNTYSPTTRGYQLLKE